MKWFIRIWVVLAIVLPALIGLVLMFSPASMTQPWVTIESLAHQVGTRDVVFSLMIIFGAFLLPSQAVAFLLLGRGIIDLMDGVWAIQGGAEMPQPVIPLVLGVISLIVAYLVWKMPGGRIFGSSK